MLSTLIVNRSATVDIHANSNHKSGEHDHDQPIFVQNSNTSIIISFFICVLATIPTFLAVFHLTYSEAQQAEHAVSKWAAVADAIVVCALIYGLLLAYRVVSKPLYGLTLSRLVIKSDGKQLEIYFETSKNCFGLKNLALKSHPVLIPFDQIAKIGIQRWNCIDHSGSGINYDAGVVTIGNAQKRICCRCIRGSELANLEVLSLMLCTNNNVDFSHHFNCRKLNRCTSVQPNVYSIKIVIDKNQNRMENLLAVLQNNLQLC